MWAFCTQNTLLCQDDGAYPTTIAIKQQFIYEDPQQSDNINVYKVCSDC